MKRWTMRISLCLLLGVVTTVGVAWSSVWSYPGEMGLPLGEVDARGWPCAALRFQLVPTEVPIRRNVQGFGTIELGVGNESVLPLRPVFPGFVVNTGMNSIVWLAIFVGFARFRQAREQRLRGLCPMCKYNLRGNPEGVTGCAECGWGRLR